MKIIIIIMLMDMSPGGEDSTLFWQSLSCTAATLQYLFSMAGFLTPGDAEIG